MRIIFMGTPEFAVPSLRILLEHSYDVAAVVTAPDKPRGRGQQVSETAVKTFARERGLPILQPDDLKGDEFRGQISALAPDLIVVVAFRILPREIYTVPRLGSFNLHASLLPKYRGAAPINWAIINGETETGVTTFFLQDKVDTGSMLLQRSIPIGPDDVAGDVHDRLAMLGADVVLETVRAIESGKAVPQAQDETLVSRAPKIFREDCRIDWTMTAKQVHDRVRGLSPSPCGWTMHGERVLKIYRANLLEGIPTQPAGTITQVTPTALHVATGNGVVALVDVQQEGKRRLPIDEFLRGYRIAVGERLG